MSTAPSAGSGDGRARPSSTLVGLPDEVLLRIFVHLSAKDLLECEAVNRSIARVAQGSILWRDLYATAFPDLYLATRSSDTSSSSSIRVAASTATPSSRLQRTERIIHAPATDWKAAFRLAHNWQRGKFLSTELRQAPPIPPLQSSAAAKSSLSGAATGPQQSPAGPRATSSSSRHLSQGDRGSHQLGQPSTSRVRTLVRPSRVSSLIYTASRPPNDTSPAQLEISVYSGTVVSRTAHAADEIRCSTIADQDSIGTLRSPQIDDVARRLVSSGRQVRITEIQVDSIPSPVHPVADHGPEDKGKQRAAAVPSSSERLMVAYSTGHIALFRVNLHKLATAELDWYLEAFYHLPDTLLPSNSDPDYRDKEVVASALHSPLLVTCSFDFTLQLFNLPPPRTFGPHCDTQTLKPFLRMRSFSCHWPASLSLRALPVSSNAREDDLHPAVTVAGDQGTPYRHAKRARLARAWHSAVAAATNAVPSSPSATLTASSRSGPEDTFFRLCIAYATPQYPASWTAGIQELIVRISPSSTSAPWELLVNRHATAPKVFRASPLDLHGRASMSSAAAAASPLPAADANAATGRSDLHLPSTDDTSSILTTLTYEDPFVVVGSRSNTLDVFQVSGSALSINVRPSSIIGARDRFEIVYAGNNQAAVRQGGSTTSQLPPPVLRLSHCHVLHGHTAAVHAVALETGRCVSGGADGQVLVWSLRSSDSSESGVGRMRTMGVGADASVSLSALGKRKRRSSGSSSEDEDDGDIGSSAVRSTLAARRRGVAVLLGHDGGASTPPSTGIKSTPSTSVRHMLTLPSPSPSPSPRPRSSPLRTTRAPSDKGHDRQAQKRLDQSEGPPRGDPTERNHHGALGRRLLASFFATDDKQGHQDEHQLATVEWIATGPEAIVSVSSWRQFPESTYREAEFEPDQASSAISQPQPRPGPGSNQGQQRAKDDIDSGGGCSSPPAVLRTGRDVAENAELGVELFGGGGVPSRRRSQQQDHDLNDPPPIGTATGAVAPSQQSWRKEVVTVWNFAR